MTCVGLILFFIGFPTCFSRFFLYRCNCFDISQLECNKNWMHTINRMRFYVCVCVGDAQIKKKKKRREEFKLVCFKQMRTSFRCTYISAHLLKRVINERFSDWTVLKSSLYTNYMERSSEGETKLRLHFFFLNAKAALSHDLWV